MSSREKIYQYILQNGPVKPHKILNYVDIGEQMLYRHLKRLLLEKKIKKTGSGPQVFYSVFEQQNVQQVKDLSAEVVKIIEKEFYFITPSGKKLLGLNGFILWCQKRNFDVRKKAKEFLKIRQKYRKIRKNDLLDATSKVEKAFRKNRCIDKLFYYDFYSIEIFGKTKIGQKLLYAKQSQDRKKIIEISMEIKNSLKKIIQLEKIDSVVFIPPTVPRKIQFMKVLEQSLNLKLPQIKVTKIISDIRVPQKTLKRMEDRIENANTTFYVDSLANFKNTLIIDDAVGSGASINQVACKLKKNKNSQKVIGFAITGSLNNFEVIAEV